MNSGIWTKFEGNPILGGERLGTCFDVNVVRDGPAPWTMYFSWRPRKAIALVRSDDGLHWSQEPEVCLEADPASGWEDTVNRSCTVFKDGVWHLWHTGQAGGMSRIARFTIAWHIDLERIPDGGAPRGRPLPAEDGDAHVAGSSFSVLVRCRGDAPGRVIVHPAAELWRSLPPGSEKNALAADIRAAAETFAGRSFADEPIADEHTL